MHRCLECSSEWAAPGWECAACGAHPATIDGFPSFAPALAQANSGFRPEHFELLSAIDATHFWFRARGAMVVRAIERWCGRPESVLEIGCGPGGMLERIARSFPDARLAGSDIYTAALPFAARRLPSAALFQMDATAIPFSQEFSVIVACDVIEHIDDDVAALQNIRRALVDGGVAVLTVPQDPKLWSSWDELSCHKRRYERGQLVSAIRGAGLKVEWIVSTSALIYPLLRLARLRRGDSQDPLAELRVARGVNFVLDRVMDLERFLIRQGADFPFGGSLLAVARRV